MEKKFTITAINGAKNCHAHEQCDSSYNGYIFIQINKRAVGAFCVEYAQSIGLDIIRSKQLIKKNGQ